jgi:integrase
MPRPSKGPRLVAISEKGAHAVWRIRDGEKMLRCRDEHGAVIIDSGPESRERAERALAAYLGEKHQPEFRDGDPASVLITDVLTFYSRGHLPTIAHPEIALYQMPKLLGFFAGKMASDITPGLCRAYVDKRLAEPNSRYKPKDGAPTPPRVSPSTIRRELVTLHAALNYAYEERKLLYKIPVAKPKESEGRDRWLTRAEAARLLLAAWRQNHHVARFILLALYTGTRHEAVLALRWGVNSEGGWIDLERRLLYRRGSNERETKKKRTPVPISDRLAAHLARWRKHGERLAAEIAATGRKGDAADLAAHVITYRREIWDEAGEMKVWKVRPISEMRVSWRQAIKRAKLPGVTPHVLRHTFATWAVQDGVPFAKIARAMGTTEAMIERRYGHHAPDHLRDVVERVSGRGRK